MRHEYQARMPEVADKIKFYIGDVRDMRAVSALSCTALITYSMPQRLKQVPSCEFFPMEAVQHERNRNR